VQYQHFIAAAGYQLQWLSEINRSVKMLRGKRLGLAVCFCFHFFVGGELIGWVKNVNGLKRAFGLYNTSSADWALLGNWFE
jgi:hypothetical protein